MFEEKKCWAEGGSLATEIIGRIKRFDSDSEIVGSLKSQTEHKDARIKSWTNVRTRTWKTKKDLWLWDCFSEFPLDSLSWKEVCWN